MRACFLGQNICALGYGVATLQSLPIADEEASAPPPGEHDQAPPARSSAAPSRVDPENPYICNN